MVIRSEGPKGGPGMREMLSPTSAIMGRGLGKDVALITDGRFSAAGRTVLWWGTSRPRRTWAGRLRWSEGDRITIDAEKRELTLDITAAEMKAAPQDVEKARSPVTPAVCWPNTRPM